jgi:antitoxin component YwqK of YwqJK toxin-antitoxin module
MLSGIKTKGILFIGCTIVALISCNHQPAPKTSAPATQQIPNSYPDATKDTSGIYVDKKAPDGLNVIKYKNGVIKAKGYYSSGKRNGEWQSFYDDGKLWSDQYFTDGLPDGKINVWYNNGEKMYEGQYQNGKPAGVWSYWDDKGKLLRTADYSKKSPNTAL